MMYIHLSTKNQQRTVLEMNNWLKRFIEKLAQANNETFNGTKLNCCDLNKQEDLKARYQTVINPEYIKNKGAK